MAEMRQAPRHDWRRGWLGPFLVFLAMLLLTLWWLGVFKQPDGDGGDGGGAELCLPAFPGFLPADGQDPGKDGQGCSCRPS